MNKGVQFRKVSAYKAIREIYSHPKSWEFLLNFVENSEEVEVTDEGVICFIDIEPNYFTNEDKYFWIAGYDNGRLSFLQLVQNVNSAHMELVIAQKKHTTKSKDWFGSLLEFLSKNYFVKYLTTFPMNDKLKEYYISNGFYEYKKELRLDLK